MKNKILFLGSNQSDWQNISATNPIDEISLTLNDTPDLLIKFVNKHTMFGRSLLISFMLFGSKEFFDCDGRQLVLSGSAKF